MLAAYAWIEHEKQFFGKEGSVYDFKDINEKLLDDLIKTLEDKREELKKRINP